ANVELKYTIVVVMPKIMGEGYYTCIVRVEYEWKPLGVRVVRSLVILKRNVPKILDWVWRRTRRSLVKLLEPLCEILLLAARFGSQNFLEERLGFDYYFRHSPGVSLPILPSRSFFTLIPLGRPTRYLAPLMKGEDHLNSPYLDYLMLFTSSLRVLDGGQYLWIKAFLRRSQESTVPRGNMSTHLLAAPVKVTGKTHSMTASCDTL
nr:hypothetical protein [Tanacetum cinerariifolium]